MFIVKYEIMILVVVWVMVEFLRMIEINNVKRVEWYIDNIVINFRGIF